MVGNGGGSGVVGDGGNGHGGGTGPKRSYIEAKVETRAAARVLMKKNYRAQKVLCLVCE